MRAITCRNIREIISLRAVDATRLSCYAICVISVICGSLSSCGVTSQLEQDSAYRDSVATHYAEHLRYLSTLDSVYRHDSVSVHLEKCKVQSAKCKVGGEECRVQSGECVDTLYVERWHTYFKYRDRAVHDTIRRTDTVVVTKTRTITKTITKPPPPATRSPTIRERLRAWWKGCLTGGIGVLLLGLALYVILRIYRRKSP